MMYAKPLVLAIIPLCNAITLNYNATGDCINNQEKETACKCECMTCGPGGTKKETDCYAYEISKDANAFAIKVLPTQNMPVKGGEFIYVSVVNQRFWQGTMGEWGSKAINVGAQTLSRTMEKAVEGASAASAGIISRGIIAGKLSHYVRFFGSGKDEYANSGSTSTGVAGGAYWHDLSITDWKEKQNLFDGVCDRDAKLGRCADNNCPVVAAPQIRFSPGMFTEARAKFPIEAELKCEQSKKFETQTGLPSYWFDIDFGETKYWKSETYKVKEDGIDTEQMATEIKNELGEDKVLGVWQTRKDKDETGVIVQLNDIKTLDDLTIGHFTDGQLTGTDNSVAGQPRQCNKGCGWTGLLTSREQTKEAFDCLADCRQNGGCRRDKEESANGFLFFVLDPDAGKKKGEVIGALGARYVKANLDPPHVRQRCFYPNQETKEHPATGSCSMLVAFQAQKKLSTLNPPPTSIRTWQHAEGKWSENEDADIDAKLLSGKHEVMIVKKGDQTKMVYKGNAVFGAPCIGVQEGGNTVDKQQQTMKKNK